MRVSRSKNLVIHSQNVRFSHVSNSGALPWTNTQQSINLKAYIQILTTVSFGRTVTRNNPLQISGLLSGCPPLPDKLVRYTTLCIVPGQLFFKSNKALLFVDFRGGCPKLALRVPLSRIELIIIL